MGKDVVVDFLLNLDDSNFESSIASAKESIGELVSGGAMLAGGTKILKSIGTEAVNMASSFETSSTKVSTLFGNTAVDTENLKNKIVDLSDATGLSADELNDGLYQALSAGVPVTEDMGTAIEFLTDATKLSKAGFADMSDAVDVTTTVMNAYGDQADSSKKIMDNLIQTQNDGKTTVAELASSLGAVIPIASSLNVNFDTLSASIAILTKNGIATSEAVTDMKALFTEFSTSTSDVNKMFTELNGKSIPDFLKSGGSLQEVIKTIDDNLQEQNLSWSDVLGSTEAVAGAQTLAKNGTKDLSDEIKKMTDDTGAMSDAYDKVSSTSAMQFQRIVTSLKNECMKWGTVILETLNPALEFLADHMDTLAPIIVGVGVALGGLLTVAGGFMVFKGVATGISVLVTGLGGLTSILAPLGAILTGIGDAILAVGAALLTPEAAIAALVVAVGALGVAVVKNWDDIKAKTKELAQTFTDLVDTFSNSFKFAMDNAQSDFANGGNNIINTASAGAYALSDVFTQVGFDSGANFAKNVAIGLDGLNTFVSEGQTAFQTFEDNAPTYGETTGAKYAESFVKAYVEGVSALGKAGDFFGGIKQSFTDFNASVSAEFDTIKTTVTTKITEIKTSIGTAFGKVGNIGAKVGTFFGNLGTSLSTGFTNAINTIKDTSIGDLQGWLNGMGEIIHYKIWQLPGMVQDWSAQMQVSIQAWAENAPANIEAWLGRMGQTFVTAFTSLPDKLDTLATTIDQKFTAWGQTVPQAITAWLNTLGLTVLTKLNELPAKIEAWGQVMQQNITIWAQNAPANITNFLNTLGTTIQTSLSQLPAKIQAWSTQMGVAIQAWAQSLPEKITTFLNNFGKIVSDWFANTPAKVAAFFTNLGTWITQNWPTIWKAFVLGVQGILTAIFPEFRVLITGVSALFKNWDFTTQVLFPILQALFKVGWEIIKAIVKVAIQLLVDFVKWLADNWPAIVKVLMEILKGIFKVGWEIIKGIVKLAIKALFATVKWLCENWPTIVRAVMEVLKTIIKTGWNIIKTIVETAVKAVYNSVKEWFDMQQKRIEEWFASIPGKIQSGWDSMAQSVEQGAKAMYDSVVTWFDEQTEKIQTFCENIPTMIKTAFDTAVSNVETALSKLPGVITSAIGKAGAAAKSTWNSTLGKLPIVPSFSPMPNTGGDTGGTTPTDGGKSRGLTAPSVKGQRSIGGIGNLNYFKKGNIDKAFKKQNNKLTKELNNKSNSLLNAGAGIINSVKNVKVDTINMYEVNDTDAFKEQMDEYLGSMI